MDSVVVAGCPPLGVTVCGLKPQFVSFGSPLQVKFTVELNPPVGDTVSVAVPVLPAVIVSLLGLADTV